MKNINKDFPRPKFRIGQEVRIKENYTMIYTDKVYIIVEIKLSCISVITDLKNKKEPFTYSIVGKENLGQTDSMYTFDTDIRESFITDK